MLLSVYTQSLEVSTFLYHFQVVTVSLKQSLTDYQPLQGQCQSPAVNLTVLTGNCQ